MTSTYSWLVSNNVDLCQSKNSIFLLPKLWNFTSKCIFRENVTFLIPPENYYTASMHHCWFIPKIQTVHAPYCIVLGCMREPSWSRHDLDLPCASNRLDWIGNPPSPVYRLTKESKLRELPYLINSPWSLLCYRFESWTFHAS